MGMQCIPAIFLLILMSFMPNSPRWLVSQGRNYEALQVISLIRNEKVHNSGTALEFKLICDLVDNEKKAGNGDWSEFFVEGIRNRLSIAVMLQFWQQFTGINVILYYQGSLLTAMGINPKLVQIPFTIANNLVNFLATIPSFYLVDTIGRRNLIIIGGYGMGLLQFSICLFAVLSESTGIKSLNLGAICSIYFFFIFFASTWG